MSDTLLYLVIGILGIIAVLVVVNYLLGGRLRRAKFGVSPKDGIYGEFETHEPKFEIDTPAVKVKSREEPIMPASTPTQSQQSPQAQPEPIPQAQGQVAPPSPILAAELTQGKPKFMSDEYVVDIATRLQIDSEEGDLVRFVDHTADNSEQ